LHHDRRQNQVSSVTPFGTRWCRWLTFCSGPNLQHS